MIKTANKRNNSLTQSQIALHMMVNQLSVNTMAVDTLIANDIPEEIYVNANQHKLASVLGSLLKTMVTHTNNIPIHISAKPYGNVTLLHLKTKSELNSPSFKGSLSRLQQLAENEGGTVELTSYRNNITTVAMSFINTGLVA